MRHNNVNLTQDEIFARYWHGLDATFTVAEEWQDGMIALALRLAIAEAADSATPNNEAAQAERDMLRQQLANERFEIAALRTQLLRLDADNADLTQRLTNLAGLQTEAQRLRQEIADLREQVIPDYQNSLASMSTEIDRLTRQNVIATDTFNSLAHSNGNGNGVDPTTPTSVVWGRACPAWDGMTDEEREAVYDLASGRVKFGELSMELRTEILTRVLRYTMYGAERLTMAQFDNRKPDWMPIASGLVRVFGGQWLKMLDLASAPA